MTTALEKSRRYFAQGTTDALAIACATNPDYCRKLLTLDRLLAVWRDGWDTLHVNGRVDEVRDEVIQRLLITADRGRHREEFLRLFRDRRLQCPYLERFANTVYRPRPMEMTQFVETEARYLAELRRVKQDGTDLMEAVNGALIWLGVYPGLPIPRVLFSNEATHKQYPTVVVRGVCVPFRYFGGRQEGTFPRWQADKLGQDFIRSAEEAEAMAHDILERNPLKGKQRQIKMDDTLADQSYLDGASGYLAFLMARLSNLTNLRTSPYIGFTGTKRERERLGRVVGLAHKLDAAVDAGMWQVYVPQSDYDALTSDELKRWEMLKLTPFPEKETIPEVAQRLLHLLRGWMDPNPDTARTGRPIGASRSATIGPSQSRGAGNSAIGRPKLATPKPAEPRTEPEYPATRPVPSAGSGNGQRATGPVTASQVQQHRQPAQQPEPASKREPELLFDGRLRAFLESGGSTRCGVPAVRSAYSAQQNTFLAIFPQRQRLYLLDAFGSIPDDGTLQTEEPVKLVPLSVTWSDSTGDYVVGFHTGRVVWFAPDLSGRSRCQWQLPPEFVPRHLTAAGPTVLAADRQRIRCVGPGSGPVEVTLPGVVESLEYAAPIDRVLACIPNRVIALTRDLRVDWEWAHTAPTATAVVTPDLGLWVALSTGTLMRLGEADRRRLIRVDTVVGACGLAVTEQAVVVGSRSGVLVVHHPDGTELGRDDLATDLNHLTAGSGESLIVSTARGPSVLRPNPAVFQQVIHPADEDAVRTIDRWLRGGATPAVAAEINLADWPRVVALQKAYLRRRKADPQLCLPFEQRLEFIDARKKACICAPTRPAIIDGSNVSRCFWNDEKAAGNPNPKSRLKLIHRMQDKLIRMAYPPSYPIITVVDVSEQRVTDSTKELDAMIRAGTINLTANGTEADALILSWIREHGWADNCIIVSNDKRMQSAHAEMIPGVGRGWYEGVQRMFQINPQTLTITLVERSR